MCAGMLLLSKARSPFILQGMSERAPVMMTAQGRAHTPLLSVEEKSFTEFLKLLSKLGTISIPISTQGDWRSLGNLPKATQLIWGSFWIWA